MTGDLGVSPEKNRMHRLPFRCQIAAHSASRNDNSVSIRDLCLGVRLPPRLPTGK
jgi:hypothetical protein